MPFSRPAHLPPCGANARASRTWVEIRDAQGPDLYGYCGIRSANELASVMFLPEGLAPPHVRFDSGRHERPEVRLVGRLESGISARAVTSGVQEDDNGC